MNEQMPDAVGKSAQEARTAGEGTPVVRVPPAARDDLAERPGTTHAAREHADELADEWGEESFPGSDPPAHY